MKSKAWTEKFMQGVFAVAACASVLAVALICIFLVCKRNSGNEENRICEIHYRRNVASEVMNCSVSFL